MARSEEHTSELQSPDHLVCRLLLEKKKSSSHTNVEQMNYPKHRQRRRAALAQPSRLARALRRPRALSVGLFFFFNDTATTEIYTLSLHDALPIGALDPVTKRCHHGARRCGGWLSGSTASGGVVCVLMRRSLCAAARRSSRRRSP